MPLVRQATVAECGIACLAMIAYYYGYKTDLTELRRKHALSLRGINAVSLLKIANEIELGGRSVKCDMNGLAHLRTPCILHWEFQHFVVLKKVTRSHIVIYDPAAGVRKLDFAEASKAFTGVAFEFSPTQNFKRKPPPNRLKLTDLVRFDGAFFSRFSLGLIVTFVAELFLLAGPIYMQVVIDDVLIKGDKLLLEALALGFGLIVFIQTASNILRRLTYQFLSYVLSFDMAARIFQKMISLPVNYFTNRQMGDIQHRVKSMDQIQHFMTINAPNIIVDGIFSVLILTIMFVYHAPLTFLIVSAVAMYALWRTLIFGVMRRAAQDLIVSEASADTYQLETLRCINTLKIAALESVRSNKWQGALARKTNAGLRVGNLDIVNLSVNEFLFQ